MQARGILAASAVTLGLMVGSAANAQNIVVDGSFEAGGGAWSASSFFIGTTGIGRTGSNSALTGCVSHGCVATLNAGAYFQQALATNAGGTYDLSFWVDENQGPTSEFSVFWDGALIADVINPANNACCNYGPFVQYSYTGLVASGTSTVLQVHGRQDPGGINFDDFVVTESTPGGVPEPATWALMIGGFGLAGAALRRRRLATAA